MSDSITAAIFPSYIYVSYPTLKIGPTIEGTIGTEENLVLNYQIKARTSLLTEFAFVPLTIIINHECSGAEIIAIDI